MAGLIKDATESKTLKELINKRKAKKEYARQQSILTRNNQRKPRTQHISTTTTIPVSVEIRDKNQPKEKYTKYFLDELLKLEKHVNELARTQHVPDLQVFDDEELIIYLFPQLDDHHCPNCGYNFGKPLSRGKRCPECGEQLRVRHRLILDEKCLETIKEKQNLWIPVRQIKDRVASIEDDIRWKSLIWAAKQIAESYEALGEYDKAWDIMSGKILPICEIQAIDYINSMEDKPSERGGLLDVAVWRAEFVERCFEKHVWKINAEWVLFQNIELLSSSINYGVSHDCAEVVRAVYKIKRLYLTNKDQIPPLADAVWQRVHKSDPQYATKILKMLE